MTPATLTALLAVGSVGLFVGAFLHRCVRRLPLGKSLVWPVGEYCERCYQPLPRTTYVPVIGPALAGRRCRHCRSWLPLRGAFLSLLTAAGFVGLYWLHVVNNGALLPVWSSPFSPQGDQQRLFALFVYHALLFGFLVVATFIDWDLMIIPDSVTVPGMVVGVLLGTFWYVELHPVALWVPQSSASPHAFELLHRQRWEAFFGGVDRVPAWAEWFRATFANHWWWNWNRYLGFATGLVGLLIGGGSVWIVRFIYSAVIGKEAIGFGDVTLMAMIGAFLGWQSVILAFCLAPVSAMFVGLPGLLFRGRGMLAFGPHLAIGALLCIVFWQRIWSETRFLFYNIEFFMYFAAALAAMLAIVALLVDWAKRLLQRVLFRPRPQTAEAA